MICHVKCNLISNYHSDLSHVKCNLISNYHSDLSHVKCNFPHFIYKTKYEARLGNDFIGNLISDYQTDLSHDNVLQNAISLLF